MNTRWLEVRLQSVHVEQCNFFEGEFDVIGEDVQWARVHFNEVNVQNFQLDGLTDSAFTDCDLPHLDAQNARVTRVIFTGSRLPNANFKSAILTGCDFSHTTMTASDFSECTAPCTSFYGSYVSGSMYQKADLTQSNFSHGTLHEVDFAGAKLTDAQFQQAQCQDVSLVGATCVRLHCLELEHQDVQWPSEAAKNECIWKDPLVSSKQWRQTC
jgi:uncharacterized protein YjbI with pentapeptide repeats